MYYSDVFASGPTGMDASWVMSQYTKQQMVSSSDQSAVRGVLSNPVFNKFKGGNSTSSAASPRGSARINLEDSVDGSNPMAQSTKNSSVNGKSDADLYDVYDM